MLPNLIPLAHQYAIGDRMLDRLVGDFSPGDWRLRDPAGHDALWITGHLVVTRRRLCVMAGSPSPGTELDAAFQRGTKPGDVPADVEGRTLIDAFHQAHGLLGGRWDLLTGADLAKPLGRTLPDGSDTIGGAMSFLAWHESYHLGQLGLLRRLAGKPGIA